MEGLPKLESHKDGSLGSKEGEERDGKLQFSSGKSFGLNLGRGNARKRGGKSSARSSLLGHCWWEGEIEEKERKQHKYMGDEPIRTVLIVSCMDHSQPFDYHSHPTVL